MGAQWLHSKGGLGDGLGTLGYLYGLSEAFGKEGWTLVHTLLSTSYSQFGIGTLEEDAREIGQIVDYLRNERGKQKIVLLGHSTGCVAGLGLVLHAMLYD